MWSTTRKKKIQSQLDDRDKHVDLFALKSFLYYRDEKKNIIAAMFYSPSKEVGGFFLHFAAKETIF